jgi:hypothetical protein
MAILVIIALQVACAVVARPYRIGTRLAKKLANAGIIGKITISLYQKEGIKRDDMVAVAGTAH